VIGCGVAWGKWRRVSKKNSEAQSQKEHSQKDMRGCEGEGGTDAGQRGIAGRTACRMVGGGRGRAAAALFPRLHNGYGTAQRAQQPTIPSAPEK